MSTFVYRPLRRCLVAGVAAVLAMPVAPEVVDAQASISARSANIRIGGRLHTQYQSSSVDGSVGDFFTRRARIILDVELNDFIDGRLQPDFAGGRTSLQDAYVRLNFSDGFRVSVGQMKRAFDLFELSSSTDMPIIERTGRVTGLDSCTGVGSVCSYSRLTEALDFAGRDVGVKFDGLFGAFGYQVTVTNGPGSNRPDENDRKSASGRLTYDLTDGLTVGGNFGLHDYVEAGETEYAAAWAADAQLGTWRDGFMMQAGLAGGDNWRSLDAQGVPGGFLAAQVTASVYRPVAGERLVGVEPVFRVSTADPDDTVDSDAGLLITPGLMLYFSGKNRIGANIDYYRPDTGDSAVSFRIGTFIYF
jgi:hypothetical protein